MNVFEIGDIVSRDGTDEHLVYQAGEKGDNIGVVCIVEPASGWTHVGETEENCEWRYTLIRHASDERYKRERDEAVGLLRKITGPAPATEFMADFEADDHRERRAFLARIEQGDGEVKP